MENRIDHIDVKKLCERSIPGHATFLNIYFTCKFVYNLRVNDQHGNLVRVMNITTGPEITKKVNAAFSSVGRLDTFWKMSYDAMSTELSNLPVSKHTREGLILNVLCKVRNGLNKSDSPKNNAIDFEVNVVFETYRNIPMYMYDENFSTLIYMVPATRSSIQALESKTMDCSEGLCPICLDEMMEDCEAVILPCSHPFHGDCVRKWLRTSHYCPMCRYEMPTTS